MHPALRILINFLITATMVLLFVNFGWIELLDPPNFVDDEFFNSLFIGGTIGTLMFILGEIFDVVYKVFKIATLGLGKLVYPIYFIIAGYLKLFLPTLILLGWYTHTSNIFAVLIISILIGLVRMPPSKDRKKKK